MVVCRSAIVTSFELIADKGKRETSGGSWAIYTHVEANSTVAYSIDFPIRRFAADTIYYGDIASHLSNITKS